MSFLRAAVWSITAVLATYYVAVVLVVLKSAPLRDPVTIVLCMAVGFMVTLFFMLLAQEREHSLSQVLGFRRTNGWLYILGIGLGVALQAPLGLVSELTQKLFPLTEEARSAMEAFRDVSTWQRKVALLVAAGIVGPVVEEVFFRGGIFRGLRRAHSAALTLLGMSLLFAAAHLDPGNALPDFLGGLAMGYVRIMSGSIWPGILVHMAFNSTTVVQLIRSGPEGPVSTLQLALSMALTIAMVVIFRAIAARSERCAQAREQDLA